MEALGHALQLDAVELAHLRSLATAGGRQKFRREGVPDSLCRIVESLPEPAYLTGQRWDILAWNGATVALFGDFGQLPIEDRNILHWMLTATAAKRVFGRTWAVEARRMVSLFRAAHDLWPGDAAFAALVSRLPGSCAQFSLWWAEHGIAAPLSGIKHLHHPTLGVARYEYTSSRRTTTRHSSSPSTRAAERRRNWGLSVSAHSESPAPPLSGRT